MRIRTGHGPNDWRDDGPQTAAARVNHYSVGANTGAAMVPMPVSTNLGATPAEMVRRARKRDARQEAARIAAALKPLPPVCDAPMRFGGLCARKAGHTEGHLSRAAMDRERDSRRKRTA